MTHLGSPSEREASAWLPALPLDDVWEGEMVAVRVGGAEVLIVNLGHGDLRAYDNRCPHAGSRLSEGRLDAAALRCGAHHWEFDVRTGAGINPRSCQLRQYALRVESGIVLVQLESAEATNSRDSPGR